MASHFDQLKRDFQFTMDGDDLELCLSVDKYVGAPDKRRRTIHGNEISKENLTVDQFCFKKTGNMNTIKIPISSGATMATTCNMTLSQTPEMSLKDVFRKTLRRRVSTNLLKHKLKKFQDYSLPYQSDKFAVLKDTCNIQTASTSKALRNQKSTPPPKPPRQKLPKNSKSQQTGSDTADMSSIIKKPIRELLTVLSSTSGAMFGGVSWNK